MAKKKKKSPKKPPVRKMTSAEAWHLETLLYFTTRNITDQGNIIDDFFKAQADKLKKRLEALK
jgi:hypothetical protein